MSVSLSVDGPGDAELISAVRGGDVDAYGELFARHVDAARRLARQLAGPADADDLVSDAFTKVLTVLQRGGGPDLAFRAYLLTAVRRLHVDRIRATSRLKPVDDLTPFDPGLPFQDTAVEGFENAAAARAFASLPERWQMVLWHTEVEGQKPADVAPLLGMSANSVSALAYRAREGLRQAFLSQHATDPDDVDCAWTRDHLGAYVRGGLSRRDAGKVDDHLAECRPCAAVYLELTEVNSGLAALLAPLLLGSAGAGYLSSTGGGAAAGGAASSGLAAAKAWVGTHASLTAVGGLAVTATALFAIYGATQLQGHQAADLGSPPGADRGVPGSSQPAGPGSRTQHGRDHGRRTGPDRASQTPSVVTSTGAVPSPSTAADSSSPAMPSTAPDTQPSGGPGTDPSSGPTDPTTGPSDPSGGSLTFTSTPPADPTFGSTYDVSASGGSGTISFSIDPSTTNAACSLAGHTVTFDHAGTCVIAAHQAGGSAARLAAGGSADATQSVVVHKGDQAVLLSQPPQGAVVGDAPYAVKATGGASGNPVAVTVPDGTTACTLDPVVSDRVLIVHRGVCTITAHQDGSADYHAANTTQSFDVGRGAQAVEFQVNSAALVFGGSGTLAVTAAGHSGNPVTFSSGTPATCSVTGDTVTFDHAGDCAVRADQAASDDYAAATTVTHVLAVAKADQNVKITTTPPATPRFGDTYTPQGTAGSGDPVVFTIDKTTTN
ncbi:MAG TPA: sigma-70 family RNA polymerase sigma factor, partial [Nocardioides sp.]|nr:sigma-70 family RNA polymerase sigma factor [Nocardioides sp.]